MRLIIDTDAGIDDAQAIMMALTYPGVTVEAITTVTGNVYVDKVLPNICTILHVMGKTVPVYRGADRPLVAEYFSASYVHGEDGLGNWSERPKLETKYETEHAAQALIRMANEAPGEYTLIAIGPLTNIALAAHLDPSFPSKIKQFVFMGGTIAAHGNAPMVTAEYNIYADPEAAFMTLKAFPHATMLSWETTMKYPISWQQYEEWVSMPTDRSRFMKGITQQYVDSVRQRPEPPSGYRLPDPLAMAITLEPSLIRASGTYFTTVELQGAFTRGQTVIDYAGKRNLPTNVEIITDLDIESVFRLLKQSVS